MQRSSGTALLFMLALSLGVAACSGEGGASKGGATPPENISEAEPEGVGGTSNQ